jgi:hypothetical protein
VESSHGTRFLVKAGLGKVYADDGLTQTEITRYTDGKAISSITHVTTTATLVTATAHGRTTGDLIDLFGAAPSGLQRHRKVDHGDGNDDLHLHDGLGPGGQRDDAGPVLVQRHRRLHGDGR